MEIVNEDELKRYAIIDIFDCIFFDSDDLNECLETFNIFGNEFRGVYDYKEQKYVKRTP